MLAACVDGFVARRTIAMVRQSLPVMEAESDPDLAEAAAPGGIKQLEGFHLAWGPDRELETLLARATCGYGAGFLADRAEAARLDGDDAGAAAWATRARGLLERCAGWATRGLGRAYEGLAERSDADAAAVLARARARDAELLFWLGTSLAASIGAAPDDPRVLARAPRAIAILERVVALDDDLEHGRPHVMLGILHAATAAAVGGDPERGRRHLEHALSLTEGRLLLAHVMMARIYAVTTRDAALFDERLARVLATPTTIWPEQRLDNELAHRKARRYQAQRARWFPAP